MRFRDVFGRMGSGMAVGAVLLAIAAVDVTAQDVSVSELRWTDSRGAPDQLPQVTASRLPLPEELKGTNEINYIVIEYTLDAKGRRLVMFRYATMPLIERYFQERYEALRFTPGKRAGKAVNTAVTTALIFNPATASAEAKAPEATPRLLEVAKVPMPRPKGAKRGDTFEDRVVFATALVNEQGEVAELKDAPPEWAEPAQRATKAWRFAPARKGGVPVAAEVRVPLVLTWGREDKEKGNRVTPKAIDQVKPLYPLAMRANGMRGEVVVDFIVDIEGRVRNAYVVRSLNPSFDDPAIEAVQRWRFEPGRIGERPVPTRMQVPIIFSLEDTYGGGRDGLDVRRKANLSKLPEELRYDTPAKITGMMRAVYPHALLAQKKEGKASVTYVVNERGRISEAKVVEATSPEFGLALQAAVEQFAYEPALKKGRPIPSFATFTQEFKPDDYYQLVTEADLELLRRETRKPKSIVALNEVDGKLKPLSQRPPRFPVNETERTSGEAVIEFIVDEEGRARLPRIVSATSGAFGHAATTAVATWRFEPPTRAGRAVDVRVTVPIKFTQRDYALDAAKK